MVEVTGSDGSVRAPEVSPGGSNTVECSAGTIGLTRSTPSFETVSSVKSGPIVSSGQKASGYNSRAKVEAAIGRWKQVIGDGLRSRIDECRATEVEVAVSALNRMLELGRPSYVRIV